MVVPRYIDRIGAAPWRSVSSGQSESDRSAALIAMPVSMGAKIPTARHLRMSEQPNERVSQFVGKNLIPSAVIAAITFAKRLDFTMPEIVKSPLLNKFAEFVL